MSFVVNKKTTYRGGGHRCRPISRLKTCLSQNYTLLSPPSKTSVSKNVVICVSPASWNHLDSLLGLDPILKGPHAQDVEYLKGVSMFSRRMLVSLERVESARVSGG